MDWLKQFCTEIADWLALHWFRTADWIKLHWLDTVPFLILAIGILWLMPGPKRRPKLIGLLIALGGAVWLARLMGGLDASLAEVVPFSVFATVAILCAVLMITNRSPVYSALWFAMVTLSTCGLFLLEYAPFLAAATVVVYAGAIVVTFMFVIMLAQQSGATVYDQRSRQPLLATIAAFVVLGALIGTLIGASGDNLSVAKARDRAVVANPLSQPAPDELLGTMHGLGRSLFTDYLFAVELGGTLLLVATIGAIAIAPRRRRGTL
jgi:NADH-quinone oxidoreductase subunit J